MNKKGVEFLGLSDHVIKIKFWLRFDKIIHEKTEKLLFFAPKLYRYIFIKAEIAFGSLCGH